MYRLSWVLLQVFCHNSVKYSSFKVSFCKKDFFFFVEGLWAVHLGISWLTFRGAESCLQNNCQNSEFAAWFLAYKIHAELNSVPPGNSDLTVLVFAEDMTCLTFCIRAVEKVQLHRLWRTIPLIYASFKGWFDVQTVLYLIGDSPCGVKTSPCETSVVQGRGVIRLLRSASDLSKSFRNWKSLSHPGQL